jgi:hypothetical protein
LSLLVVVLVVLALELAAKAAVAPEVFAPEPDYL